MRLKRSAALLLLAVLALTLGLPHILERLTSSADRSITVACSLNDGACGYHSRLFGEILITVSPRDFPAYEPLLSSVSVESEAVKSVVIAFNGKDMYMGPNRSVLTRTPEGRWEGSGMIPVCRVNPGMVWLVNLTLAGGSSEHENLVFEVRSAHSP